MAWKRAQYSKPVIKLGTDLASVRFIHAYQLFIDKSGATEAPKYLAFGDKATFNPFEVLSII